MYGVVRLELEGHLVRESCRLGRSLFGFTNPRNPSEELPQGSDGFLTLYYYSIDIKTSDLVSVYDFDSISLSLRSW